MVISNQILLWNGIYDIICSSCILLYISSYPATIHSSVFRYNKHRNNHTLRRALAYCIFMYGSVRLYAGIMKTAEIKYMAIISYLLEAIYYENERQHKTVYDDKSIFISSVSIIFGIFVFIEI